jgi:hypothetical protein
MPDISPANSSTILRNPVANPQPKAPPSSQTPVKPGFYGESDRAPLPISKLPPLRPPSTSFQALGADISWSAISRSHLDESDPPSQSSPPSIPHIEPIGDLAAGIDRDVRQAIARHVAPVSPTAAPAISTTSLTPEPSPRQLPTPPAPPTFPASTRRRRPTRSPFTSRFTSRLKGRSAPVVYAASIGLGLLAFGAWSNLSDRPNATTPLTNVECTGAIWVDATLTPKILAQIPAKSGMPQAIPPLTPLTPLTPPLTPNPVMHTPKKSRL